MPGTQPPVDDALTTALADRYLLLKELGSGGMATVYLARDLKHDREVAVKVLHPELAATIGADRFLREIQIAAKLNHPHILTLIDSGEAAGFLYYVMPYVQGESLRTRLIREGALPIAEAVRILREVSDALAYAHRQGIVHRDIKPDNVMIADHHAVVTDFGIAKAVSQAGGGGHRTTAGVVLGTPAYMAPEQAAGDPQVDQRADLYAVGVVAYEMLAGRTPFTGETPLEVLAAHFTETPEAVTKHREAVPAPLAELVMRALAKQPADRWQTADEMVHQLEALATPGGGLAAVPAAPARALGLPVQLLRGAAVGVALTAVLALGVGLFLRGSGAPAAVERRMLVVLPFENLGPPGDDYFADGVTEEITSRLAEIPQLGVISRTSATQYKGTQKALQQIADELGVQYVLAGAVRWQRSAAGTSQVRITPELVRVSDKSQLWTDRYDAVLADIFQVQSEVAARVADALGMALAASGPSVAKPQPTDNLEAYDYYLRGNDYYRRSWQAEDLQIAAEMYGRAIALDPNFGLAHANLASVHSAIYWFYYDRSEERLRRAQAAAERALALAPELAEAHVAMGNFHYWGSREYDQALQHFSMAQARQPNNAEIHKALANVYRRQGQMEEAATAQRRAVELDPRDHAAILNLGLTLLLLRRYQEAEEHLNRAIGLAPDWAALPAIKARLYVLRDGDVDRARLFLRQAFQRIPPAEFFTDVAGVDNLLALASLADSGLATAIIGAPAPAAGFPRAQALLAKAGAAEAQGWLPLGRAYYDSAAVTVEELFQDRPDDATFRAAAGFVYAKLDRPTAALEQGRKAVELMPVERDAFDGMRWREQMARIYAAVGDLEAAVAELEFLLSIPSFVSRPMLRVDPAFGPLRDYVRFRRLIAEAG